MQSDVSGVDYVVFYPFMDNPAVVDSTKNEFPSLHAYSENTEPNFDAL